MGNSKLKNIIFIVPLFIIIFLIAFPFNAWLSLTMPRHQLVQLPSMILLGLITGIWFKNRIHLETYIGVSLFIYTIFSLSFWMLPHSIDRAVISPYFNRVMLVNMFSVGVFFIAAYKSLGLELQVFLFGMIAAMITATGYTLLHYDTLLCSSFDITQQRETGNILLWVGLTFIAFTIVNFFRNIGKM